jgi:hypothetical protein
MIDRIEGTTPFNRYRFIPTSVRAKEHIDLCIKSGKFSEHTKYAQLSRRSWYSVLWWMTSSSASI